MNLAIGDVVVYGMHGIGCVAARQEQAVLGVPQNLVVVALPDELTVTLPLDRAREQLRALAGEAELDQVQETLRQDRLLSADPWLRRRSVAIAKLSDGGVVGLAEIVGDGMHRVRIRRAKGSKPQLSSEERELFKKARALLTAEISRVRGLQQTEAESWIDQQLARAA